MKIQDLRKVNFINCTFNEVDFSKSDLRNVNFDDMEFNNVKFDKAILSDCTFKNATFRNVSFLPGFALTNKYHRAIKEVKFEGANMDKATFNSLKGIGVNLDNVNII